MQFYHLNSVKFQWKYDPVSAAYAFINIHPEAVKGENERGKAPQHAAAPPTAAQQAANADTVRVCYQMACEIWNDVYVEVCKYITEQDKEVLRAYLRPDIAWQKDLRTKCIRFVLDNSNKSFVELYKTVDAILCKAKDVFNKYNILVKYREKKAEGKLKVA